MKLKPGETLFKDESVFEPYYLPEDFLFRGSEMQELTSCVRPALRNGKANNAFIFGKPATGKTTATRLVFSELEKESKNVLTIHVNCHIYNTEYRVLGEIHKKLFGFVPPETGLPVTALYDKVFSRIAKDKKTIIIALDDLNFNELKQSNELLYDLLRVHEVYPNIKLAVWCISVQNELHKLDDKVHSTFVSRTIEFRPYKKDEMAEILFARVQSGLASNIISKQLISKISGAAVDLRHGLELLLKAVQIAEDNSSRTVNEKHVNSALKQLDHSVSSSMMDDEKIIIDLIAKKSKESGALYNEYKTITGSSYATFYRNLQKLKKEGFIEIKQVEKEKGRTSIIKKK